MAEPAQDRGRSGEHDGEAEGGRTGPALEAVADAARGAEAEGDAAREVADRAPMDPVRPVHRGRRSRATGRMRSATPMPGDRPRWLPMVA